MSTISDFHKAEAVIITLTSRNNNLVDAAIAANGELNKINALSAGARSKLDIALVALGVTVNDFDTLRSALATAISGVQANLTKIAKSI